MHWMTRADVLLLAVATYVGVMTLVRMMQRRRDHVLADVQRQIEAHRKRPKRNHDDQSRGAA